MSGKTISWLKDTARVEKLPLADELPEDKRVPEQVEDVHPSKAFGGVWSRRDRAHTVEFRLLDPEKPDESFDYNYLPRVSWHKGKGEIELLYDSLGVTVLIRGLNLSELKERLRQHLVTWVMEQGNDPIMMKQAQEEAKGEGRELVYVKQILIKKQDHTPGDAVAES